MKNERKSLILKILSSLSLQKNQKFDSISKTIKPHTKFDSQVYILTKEEGGRHTPFFVGYRPQFYVRTTDVTGKIESFRSDNDSETQMVMPGDRIKMNVELIQPIAIEKGMRFAIREGGRTVGAGIVLNIIK